MKPPDKKWPHANVAGQQPQRPTTCAQHLKPAVAQSKNAVAQPKSALPAHALRHPVAPPVYRPQSKPAVAQRKAANASQPQPRTPPAAPPVYRPGLAPKALRTKSATPQQRPAAAPQALRPRPAPPVVQRKKVTLPGAALNELIAVLALLPPDAGDDTDAYNAGLLQVLNQSGYVPDEDDKKVLKSYARAVTEPARIGSFERKWLPGELVGVATANRAKWGLDEKKDEKKAAKQGEILVYISDASGTPKSKAYEQVGKSSSVYGHAEQCALDDASGSNIYLVQNAWPCSKCLEYFRRRRDIAAKTVTIFVTHDKGSYSLDNGKTAGATGTLVITNNVISYS